jgi:hypothetical protein
MKKRDTLMSRVLNSFRYERSPIRSYEITESSKRRIAPSVSDFLGAAEGASSKLVQSRVQLYNHYQQTLMYDDTVSTLMEKRLDNIANKNIMLYRNGEPLEEENYFLKSPKFTEFITDVVMTRFWGMGLFVFDVMNYQNSLWFDYERIPIKHINPYTGHVLKSEHDSEGIPYTEDDQALFLGDPNDLGYLLQITLLSLYGRYGMYRYANYLDLASENFTTIKYRGNADDSMFDSFLKRESDGSLTTTSASVPADVDISRETQSSSQQNTLFENYSKLIEERQTKLILGNSMTTDSGSSYSQALVHQSEQYSKYASDERYLMNTLNYEFKDYLWIWGIENTEGLEFRMVPTNREELGSKLANYQALKDLGMVFTSEELRSTFGEIL